MYFCGALACPARGGEFEAEAIDPHARISMVPPGAIVINDLAFSDYWGAMMGAIASVVVGIETWGQDGPTTPIHAHNPLQSARNHRPQCTIAWGLTHTGTHSHTQSHAGAHSRIIRRIHICQKYHQDNTTGLHTLVSLHSLHTNASLHPPHPPHHCCSLHTTA